MVGLKVEILDEREGFYLYKYQINQPQRKNFGIARFRSFFNYDSIGSSHPGKLTFRFLLSRSYTDILLADSYHTVLLLLDFQFQES